MILLSLLLSSAVHAGGTDRTIGCQWPHPVYPTVDLGRDLQGYIIDLEDRHLDGLTEWPISGGLDSYRPWVTSELDPTPANHAQIIEDGSHYARPLNHLFLRNRLGHAREANCLERLLLDLHNQNAPLTQYSAEFRAWVLKRDGRLRIYFASHYLESWGPNLPADLEIQLQTDLAQGWRLAIDLHNHPFVFHQDCGPSGAGGFIVPSPQDFEQYLRSSWGDAYTEYRVTNGFYTGVFSREEARKAQAREGLWTPAHPCPSNVRHP